MEAVLPRHSSHRDSASGHDRIGPLADVNVLGIRWLAAEAHGQRSVQPEFVTAVGPMLGSLSESDQLRAASLPFLLVDLRFHDPEWWEGYSEAKPNSAPTPAHDTTISLTRSALVLAWHTARVDRHAALLMLGLSPQVADLIAALHLQDIDHIAAIHSHELRPRWARQTIIWRQLLGTAIREAEFQPMLRLHCLGLVARDLINA